MNKKRQFLLGLGTIEALLPLSVSNSPAPIYFVISSDYAPTASVRLSDDTSEDLAILELDIWNPTDHLIALNSIYFVDSEIIGSASSNSSALSSASSSETPRELYRWENYPHYQKRMYLAPKSHHLPRYVSIHKTNVYYGSKDAETYAAIKAGKSLSFAFDGTVFATETIDENHYFYSAVTLATTYNPDADQTSLEFDVGTVRPTSIDYNTRFFSFDFKGESFQTYQGSDYEETDKTWTKGNHATTEFTNRGLALYRQGDTLFATSKNQSSYYHYSGSMLWSWLYPVLGGFFILTGIAIVVGLIILLVWISKKKKQKSTPAQ